jgi:hypothetical protein
MLLNFTLYPFYVFYYYKVPHTIIATIVETKISKTTHSAAPSPSIYAEES